MWEMPEALLPGNELIPWALLLGVEIFRYRQSDGMNAM